jgi:dolichol-phosphate mannosyltransferase
MGQWVRLQQGEGASLARTRCLWYGAGEAEIKQRLRHGCLPPPPHAGTGPHRTMPTPEHAAEAPDAARHGGSSTPFLSVVVPVRNEGPNIAPLIAEIRAATAPLGGAEIVYVDDGSTDDTSERLAAEAVMGDLVHLRHRRGCGQSAAIISGVKAARGVWIATLDGDGQNDPADIPALVSRAEAEAATAPGPVLIAGHRVNRKDTVTKRFTSRFANRFRAWLLGDATPDTGCGLKLFRRADFLDLPQFDHMHRYLPALFLRAGGRVVSVPVNHRPRLRGKSNYGTFDRLAVAVADLIGVMWLQRRWKRPEVERVGAAPPHD